MSVALMGLAVALPLGVVGGLGSMSDSIVTARTCEAFAVREQRVHRIGHTIADAARQFCGQQTISAALPVPRLTVTMDLAVTIIEPWPTSTVRYTSPIRPALMDLPPPAGC